MRKIERKKNSINKAMKELFELMDNNNYKFHVAAVIDEILDTSTETNETKQFKGGSGYQCADCGHFVQRAIKPKKCVKCKHTVIYYIEPII